MLLVVLKERYFSLNNVPKIEAFSPRPISPPSQSLTYESLSMLLHLRVS